MMNRAPADAGGEGPDKGKPQRAAGTTPAAALRPDAIPAD
jgi:hypothetical protein